MLWVTPSVTNEGQQVTLCGLTGTITKKFHSLSIKVLDAELHMSIKYSEENYLEASSMKGTLRLQVGGSPIMGSTDTTTQFVFLYVDVDPLSEKLKGITTYTAVGTCKKIDTP